MSNPATLARLHAAAFADSRPWTAAEFATLLEDPLVTLYDGPNGFALTRLVAGEAELLTLAVDPAHRRQGIAAGLLQKWLDDLNGRAETAFLEVAADNPGAVALYEKLGFANVARRVGYYARTEGAAVDAVIMRLALTYG